MSHRSAETLTRHVAKVSGPLVTSKTSNTEAYSLYLEERYLWNKRPGDVVWQALDRFERAIAIDPSFAPAHAATMRETPMPQQTAGLHVDPSDETIRLGPLAVRFLIAGDDSGGSVAAFELMVPAARHLAAPAHSHDHYEETIYGIAGVSTRTVDGIPIDVGPGQALC